MIIDSHSHIHDEKFSADLDEVLKRAKDAHISHLVSIGCDIPTTKNAMAMAHRFDHIFFTAGFHPHDAKELNDASFLELKTMAQDKKCVAIGEIGLDYYYEHSDREVQKAAFKKQLDLAVELGLPVVIHLRDAYEDCKNILKNYPILLNKRIVIHCFSGTLDDAKAFVSLGCLISISGIITFKKPGELREVVKEISLDRLMVETDCPYLAPHPFRGKRNEPSFITYTLEVMAEARGEAVEIMEEQLYKNSSSFFNLPSLT